MKDLKNRKHLFAVLMLLAVFAGCKGEDPTAPPPNSGPGTGGGTPPVGASVTLTVANPNPLANSSTTITATVTSGGQPVPNGTAVEFGTTFGVFTDTGANSTIKTTTNGVATATLTATAAGTANVTAVVNNVVARATVTFQAVTTGPPPTDSAPSITGVSPTSGRPEGGELITITGRNFRGPVRVFFDVGGGRLVEAAVANQTATQVTVLTPRIDLGTGQTLSSAIVLINEAGTPSEVRIQAGTTFTFRRATLTPSVRGVSPASGPTEGGTQVTIFGDAFEVPVQVFFGAAEAKVTNVNFGQIIAISPPARDASPDGSAVTTGPITIRIRNITSGTEVSFTNGFRYSPKMSITALGPGIGSAFGGTTVTIDGSGFDDPVTVSFAGIVARPIRVSGTQVVAITGPTPSPCTPSRGETVVTNVNSGDSATGAEFQYVAELPQITSISPNTGPPGTSITIPVIKPGVGIDGTAVIRFTLAGNIVFPTPTIISDPRGPVDFVMTLPDVDFPTVACTIGGVAGTRFGPVRGSVVFTNNTTGCTDTVNNGILITPPGPNPCTLAPTPPVPGPPVAAISPATFCPFTSVPGFGNVAVAGGTNSVLLTLRNTAATGAQPLTFTTTVTGPNAGEFVLTPSAGGTVAAGAAQGITIAFDPAAAGPRDATLTILTNDPANPTFTVCLQGNGT